MAEEERDSVWEFLKVLGNPDLSASEIPYPPPELRGVESDLVDHFITDRTGVGRGGGLERGRISSPYWEAREVYGDGTARMLGERGREYAENPPDVPQHVLDNVLLPPHDAESAKQWGAPVPVGRMREGWGFDGSGAKAISSRRSDNPEGLPWSVILPTEGSRDDSAATTAHEFTHAGSRWGDSDSGMATGRDYNPEEGVKAIRRDLVSSYKSRLGDSFTDERLSSYLRGVNYILKSSREATANLSGAVRNYGSAHGRPPSTEGEVEEAILEDGARRQKRSESEYPDLEDGKTDALLKLPWTRKIGKHLVKNTPLGGCESYV